MIFLNPLQLHRDVQQHHWWAYRRPFYHAPALMLLERPIFLPTLFTASGRQPLSVRSQYAAIDVPHSKPLSLDLLISSQSSESAEWLKREAKQGEFYDRFAGWPENFDYVLMLDFGAPLNPLPVQLAPVMSGSYFTLYAISSDERTAQRAGSHRRR